MKPIIKYYLNQKWFWKMGKGARLPILISKTTKGFYNELAGEISAETAADVVSDGNFNIGYTARRKYCIYPGRINTLSDMASKDMLIFYFQVA